jgi:hypothetical protein
MEDSYGLSMKFNQEIKTLSGDFWMTFGTGVKTKQAPMIQLNCTKQNKNSLLARQDLIQGIRHIKNHFN